VNKKALRKKGVTIKGNEVKTQIPVKDNVFYDFTLHYDLYNFTFKKMTTIANRTSTELRRGLSIIVPVYNEEKYVKSVIHELRNLEVDFEYEIIIVNDGSTDNSTQILKSLLIDKHYYLIQNPNNVGKGSVVRMGIQEANYSHILIFDSDNEYFVSDIPKLFEPIRNQTAEVVFGVRVPSPNVISHSYLHSLARFIMTTYANILFETRIKDIHTGMKLISTTILRSLTLKQDGFGLDTEIACLLLKSGLIPHEIPIGYVGRTRKQGKKIRFKDALVCLRIISQIKFFHSKIEYRLGEMVYSN
jgi:glycosyltransferase involved in cell wall biosynthesis